MLNNRKKLNVNLNDKKERLFAQLPKSLKKAIVEKAMLARRSISSEVTLRLAYSLRNYDFISTLSDFDEKH